MRSFLPVISSGALTGSTRPRTRSGTRASFWRHCLRARECRKGRHFNVASECQRRAMILNLETMEHEVLGAVNAELP
jgi:hypothetical protein